MGKFKVGDPVRVINQEIEGFRKIGVIDMVDDTSIPYRVAFTERSLIGYTYWYRESSLELVMAQPGDKFVIEIESVIPSDGGSLYKIKGFNALVFDGFGIGKLERYDKPGVDVNKLIEAKERLAEVNRRLCKADELIAPFRAEVAKASNEAGLALNQIVNASAKEDSNELPY